MIQNTWNNGFQDTRHQKTKYSIPKRQEANKASPKRILSYCFFRFPDCSRRKGGGGEGGAWKALGLEETELRNQGN